jgi:hypothetical protein
VIALVNLKLEPEIETFKFSIVHQFQNTPTSRILTPKGQRSFFSKICLNLPFLAQEAELKKIVFLEF